MANETTNVSIRIDKNLKEQAESLFAALGMNMTTAFNIFMRQSVRQGKIPFEISLNIPNAVTFAAMKETKDMKIGAIPKGTQSVASFTQEMGD